MTMWEDLGVDAMKAMSKAEDGAYNATDALKGINDVKYKDIDSAMQGIKRKIEVSLLPAAESVSDAFLEQVPKLEGMIDKITPIVADFAEKIGPGLANGFDAMEKGLNWIIDNKDAVIAGLVGIGTAFGAFKVVTLIQSVASAMKGMTIAQYALNLAMSLNPLGLVIAAIAGLIAVFVVLWNKCEWFRDFWIGAWNSIKESTVNLATGIKDAFVNGFSSLVGIVKGPVNSVIGIVNGAIDAINKIGFDIPDWVPLVGGKKFSINIPNIPMLASGGFTNGVSIAGEAGREAVISFDPAYRAANLSYWAQAGRMLGADAGDFALSGGGSSSSYIDLGGVTFAPNIVVKGGSSKSDIVEAIRAAYPEFLDMLDELLAEREEGVYA